MNHKRKKITVIGAGFVGSTCAHWAASQELGDVVLVDVNDGAAKGKALDLFQSSPVEYFDSKITGTADYKDTAGSDVVIITAGIPRKPGMSRDDLVSTNAKIMETCAKSAIEYSPNAFFIIVANPLDAMCYVAQKVTNLPRERIVGMAGVLDTARYKGFIAEAANVSVEDISAIVLGGHGDTMVPFPRFTSVGGIPLDKFLPKETIDSIVTRTRNGGAEIVGLLKTGSAYYAPAASAVAMAESVLKDKKRILPCACLLNGEYGVKGFFVGVPCKLGGKGMEAVVELDLNSEEKKMLDHSVNAVKELVASTQKIMGW